MSDVLIRNDSEAERILRKVKAIEAKYDRICETCRAEAEHYKRLEEEAKQKCIRETGFYQAQLYEYFLGVKRRHTKSQEVYDLPSGTLRLRKLKKKMIPDESVLMKAFPEYVTVTPKLEWSELKRRLEISGDLVIDVDTGEVVEGITLEDIPEQFVVAGNERMESSPEDEQEDI